MDPKKGSGWKAAALIKHHVDDSIEMHWQLAYIYYEAGNGKAENRCCQRK